ncbi:MAG TPA: hypothetical protein VJV77_13915 [Casimicrobiaceae bacterium]|nr:hypothetical protein [Casimicrobiaceae bacterium]
MSAQPLSTAASVTPDRAPATAPATRDSMIAEATALIAQVRHQCAAIGLSPSDFAELLLPEALLAFMVSGMTQEQVEAVFERFARTEIAAWFLQVKRTAGYCDCAREANAEHAAHCASVVDL